MAIEIDGPIKTFQFALFNKEGNDITVDFSKFTIVNNTPLEIKNIEDNSILKSGTSVIIGLSFFQWEPIIKLP